MLRSTGFFRGIDCPFYTESLNGRSDSDRCNRPYCHFRHSKQRRAPCSPGNNRKTNDSSSKQKEQGYDPYIPEVVRPGGQPNGQPTSVPVALDQGALELELVNRAIEAVRNEVEREQKKLSRIGDQEYDPTDSGVKMGAKRHKLAPLEYDPDSYQIAPAAGYNPTPASSKYTLDSDNESTYASSLEYVPTTVTKTAIKVLTSLSPTSCSPSLSSNPPPVSACSSRHKYTLDNSKPPTDLEYDPLSNFSARPGSKNNKSLKDQRTLGAAAGRGVGSNKRLRSAAMETEDEGYVPTLKKPRLLQQVAVVESQKYTASFSESDEESSGTEYRPTSISRLRNKKNSGAFIEDWNGEEAGDSANPAGLKQQLSWQGSLQCDTKDSESSAGGLLDEKTAGRKGTIKNSHSKSGRASKVGSEEREPHRKGAGVKDGGGGDGKKHDASKKSGKQGSKKDGKSEGGKVDEKIRSEGDHIDKGSKELKKVKGNGRSVKTGKVKSESEQKDRRGGESHAKDKCPDRNRKESSRLNEMKNGKPEGGEGDRDKRQSGHARKDKAKKAAGLSDGKAPKPRTERQRSLSHADLFGDESGEDEDEGTVVRKSAAAFKRGSLMRRKRVASESAGSSSGGEDGQEEDDDGDVGVDYTKLQVDLDFDSDPMEECLRIFNESKDVKTEDRGRQAKQPPPPKETENEEDTDSTLTTLFPGQKKRVSHFMTKPNAETTAKPVVRPYRRPTAQEICYQRMQIAQQQAAQLAAVAKMTTATTGPASSFSLEKRRVAHRPNPSVPAANSGIQGASSLSPSSRTFTGSPSLSLKAHTSASILSKTTSTAAQKRVAHTPTLKSSSLKRPVIPTEFGAKVPTNVRQRYLNIFIDECLKFCPSEEMAFQKALEEEKLVYDRSSSRNIYLNVAVNTLKKLRSKSSLCTSPMAKSPAKSANKKSLSHEEVLGGRLAAKTSFTINRTGRQQEEELTGATLYRKLKEYLMTEEQLQEHCYPRPHPQRSGRAMVYNVPEKKNADPFSKVCCRCGAEYKVASNGNCVRREECNHHWGRLRRQRVPGGWETQYNCCSGAVGSPGCQVAKQHVQDGRKEALDGYVKTFNKPLPPDGNAGVYALDCEMCYTKQGLELTRVTVVNSELKVIYDTFVKPVSKVVDYNTRFSGVTQEDLESVTITLRDVQAVLLNMFSSDSILIGHSLESDFFALKLIHSTVVDTAIVFPHRLGLPYKRALRTLMADYLKRIIQDNVEGHNSSEDASACMELMMWKIREDAKVKR